LVAKLLDQHARQIGEAHRKIEELEARLNRTSKNSSEPPSSDPPSAPPRPPKPPTGRSPGGQPGHPGHSRPLLPPDQVDKIVVLKPEQCRHCRRRLKDRNDPDPVRHQITELPEPRASTTEYQRHRLWCEHCRDHTLADLPPDVPEGAFGPRLQAVLAYLSGQARLSKRQIEDVMKDLFGVTISLGAVVGAQQAVSEAVAPAVEDAKTYVQQQQVVNADETGWREGPREDGEPGRKRAWLWVAVTSWVTVFLIHARRGAEGARALLGRFAGYLVTDRWNGYNSWPLRRRQVCWAHLIRDWVGFSEWRGNAGQVGRELLKQAVRMFEVWHWARDQTWARSTLAVRMRPIRRRVERWLRKGTHCGTGKVERSCEKMLAVFPAFWTFVRVQGVEPTNNTAERTIRPAVLYRKGCFGTNSPEGSRFVERLLTVVTTLRQQGRNVLHFLTEACQNAQVGGRAPSLLPTFKRRAPAMA
jgi:transposase